MPPDLDDLLKSADKLRTSGGHIDHMVGNLAQPIQFRLAMGEADKAGHLIDALRGYLSLLEDSAYFAAERGGGYLPDLAHGSNPVEYVQRSAEYLNRSDAA